MRFNCTAAQASLAGLLLAGGLLAALVTQAQAQTNPPATAASAPAPPASAPAPTPAASAPRAAGAASTPQRVEISGGRETETDQRRQSTAAKIVIGREEIDKFGDATVGEVLRRLPGITTPGAPGRGGPPRMRGLGGGFTQLLIDGQRVAPGFSLESLSPEQIERIEILRAPTAETGARAVAGTINIITREGFRRRLNELRIGLSSENGKLSGGGQWSHNDNAGALSYLLAAGLFVNERSNRSSSFVEDVVPLTNALLRREDRQSQSQDSRRGLNLNARLQWRLGEAGDSLMLMPSLFASQSDSERSFSVLQSCCPGALPPGYDKGLSTGDSRFSNLRLQGLWRQRLGPVRLELNGGLGRFRSASSSLREEFLADGSRVRNVQQDDGTREDSINSTAKFTLLTAGATTHSLVGGIELEALRRRESSVLTESRFLPGPLLPDDGLDNLKAGSTRIAVYGQDEWKLTPQWAVHLGLRSEHIRTQGEAADGRQPRNSSTVTTPLLHLLFKPKPESRDQLRLSLTRSYRSPSLGNLIAKPRYSQRYPLSGPNTPSGSDRLGNPDLLPELASGLDLALERYLEGGGVLSANLFARRISDLIRSSTTLETVDYSPVPRYVSRPKNIGQAMTYGIELEAKFRLDQLMPGAPRVETRANASFYRSRVKTVPGPDNRLDSQSPASVNLGADYRFRGTPFSLGGNFNWTPAYRSQSSAEQSSLTPVKQVWDAFVLYTFNPATALRLSGSNLNPRDFVSRSEQLFPGLRETSGSTQASDINWQLRLELKL